jgi:Uma2 family endonuclease
MNNTAELRDDEEVVVAKPEKQMRVYTYKQYASIDEDVEVFSGRVYMMASANSRHQIVATELAAQLVQQLRGKPCVPMMDEDVELDPDAENSDDFGVFRPDLLIVCDPKKIDGPTGHIKGAPDFILEILSPSNPSTDMIVKSDYYAKAGVKEYWILDPAAKRLTICTLDSSGFYTTKRDIDAKGLIKLDTMPLRINFDEVFERFPD